jgi:peptidoglycan/LPS O-acetylase OafA/YrhL
MTSPSPLPHPPPAPSTRLPGLDLLRGIAALCVLGLHVEWIYNLSPRLFAKSYLAVDLFFMLSGYVMARTYEPRMARGLAPLRFLLTRYRRLWPVMAIGCLIGLPKLFVDTPDPAVFTAAATLNLLLLPLPWKDLAFPMNIPAWSIFLELAANLLHAAVLWRLGLRWLIALVALAVPLTIWAGSRYGDLDIGAHTNEYLASVPRITLSYVIGIIACRWWRDTPPLAVSPLLAFAAMPVLFIAASLLGMESWRFDVVFIVIACPLLIAGGLRYRPAEGSSAAVMAAALGALSFPLYAVHMPVLEGMQRLGFGSLAGGLAALATAITVALAAEALARRRKERKRAMA